MANLDWAINARAFVNGNYADGGPCQDNVLITSGRGEAVCQVQSRLIAEQGCQGVLVRRCQRPRLRFHLAQSSVPSRDLISLLSC